MSGHPAQPESRPCNLRGADVAHALTTTHDDPQGSARTRIPAGVHYTNDTCCLVVAISVS